jgi:hypothetical protein
MVNLFMTRLLSPGRHIEKARYEDVYPCPTLTGTGISVIDRKA